MAFTMDVPGTFRLGEVFSTSFNVFRRHVVAFVILSAIAHISLYLSNFVGPHDLRTFVLFWRWFSVESGIAFIVGGVCLLIAYGAITHSVLEDLAGRRVSIVQAVAITTHRLLPLVGVFVAAVMLIGLVRLLLLGLVGSPLRRSIVTWMYRLVMGAYFVMAPVCIAERTGVGAAVARCLFLTKGYRWQIFVAISLISILDIAISGIWRAGALPLAPADMATSWAGFIICYTVIDGIWIVLGAFNAVMVAVFYDRLRLAKDGVHAEIID